MNYYQLDANGRSKELTAIEVQLTEQARLLEALAALHEHECYRDWQTTKSFSYLVHPKILDAYLAATKIIYHQ